jgi:hypothetical protein
MTRYIEKHQVPVRVSWPGQEPQAGFLVPAAQSPHHEGPETVLDLLNSPLRVVPLVRGPGESVLLLTRLSIEWVMPDPQVPANLVCPRTYLVTREERVELHLVSGGCLKGLIQMELPEELNRASDFLNLPDDFFPLVTPFGRLLVNKHHVRETQVFASSPRPLCETRER